MSRANDSNRPRRPSLIGAMAVVAVIAVDFAALRPALPLDLGFLNPSLPPAMVSQSFPTIPNPGLAAMVLVLQFGLFRAIARRGPARAFWLGFELAGWAYVLACWAISLAAWQGPRALFEGYVLGRPITLAVELRRFVLFASVLHLSAATAVALVAGLVSRSAWGQGGPERPGPPPTGASTTARTLN